MDFNQRAPETTPTLEIRHRLISRVADYRDVWVFLVLLREILKQDDRRRRRTGRFGHGQEDRGRDIEEEAIKMAHMTQEEFEAHVYDILKDAAKKRDQEEEVKICIVKFFVEKMKETEAAMEALKMSIGILLKKQAMGTF